MNGVRDKLLWTFPESWTNSVMVEPTLNRLVAAISSCLNFMLHHQMLYDFCWIHTMHLTHWDRNKMVTILQTTFWNAFSWMQIGVFWLKYHWNFFPKAQLTIIQHWLGQWAGAAKETSHYLNHWWPSSLTHHQVLICINIGHSELNTRCKLIDLHRVN